MNEHIKFVKEWLADPTSKTQAEREANVKAALHAYCVASYTKSDVALADAAYVAAARAAVDDADGAASWIKIYYRSVEFLAGIAMMPHVDKK